MGSMSEASSQLRRASVQWTCDTWSFERLWRGEVNLAKQAVAAMSEALVGHIVRTLRPRSRAGDVRGPCFLHDLPR